MHNADELCIIGLYAMNSYRCCRSNVEWLYGCYRNDSSAFQKKKRKGKTNSCIIGNSKRLTSNINWRQMMLQMQKCLQDWQIETWIRAHSYTHSSAILLMVIKHHIVEMHCHHLNWLNLNQLTLDHTAYFEPIPCPFFLCSFRWCCFRMHVISHQLLWWWSGRNMTGTIELMTIRNY